MSQTEWNTPVTIIRGAVVEARNESKIDHLMTSIQECWEKVKELCAQLATSGESIQITSEIWPDTGRIIWVLRDRREFCRVELTAIEVERAYFEMLHSPTFETKYEVLMERLKHLLRDSFDLASFSLASKVVVRDSDVQETEEVLIDRDYPCRLDDSKEDS